MSKLLDLYKLFENGKKEKEQLLSLITNGHLKVGMLTDDKISEGLKYHIDNNISLTEPIFRLYSKAYFELLTEAKTLYKQSKLVVEPDSEWIFEEDFGKFAEFDGEIVPLDFPMSVDSEDDILKMAAEYKGKNVSIGKPRAIRKGEPGHGRKQYVVFVKNKDNVKRITFGDPDLRAKPHLSKNRKSFKARHKCHTKKDKTTPGYWACRYPPNW